LTKEVVKLYNVGIRIKTFRLKRGLSQKEFSARIGAKNTTVSNWEKGMTRPDVDTLTRICSVLDVSADELLGIRLSSDSISGFEKRLVLQYRERQELHKAIHILLGIDAQEQPES